MANDFMADRRKDEEKYFYERDRELIEKLRKKAEHERRETEKKHRKQTHWMKCPKCGGEMKEEKMGAIMIDKCHECGGIYFDSGELDVLLAAEKEGSVLRRIFGR